MERFAIFGAGGHGRVIADMILACGGEIAYVLDDAPSAKSLAGKEAITKEKFLTISSQKEIKIALAIGDNHLRKEIYYFFKQKGFELPSIIHSSAIISEESMIEEAILKKLNSENLCSEVTESQNVITIDNVSDIIYFPFAISSFKYKDNIYQTAVEIFKNGNGGGKRPIDKDFKNSIENMSKKYIIIAPIFLILFMLFIKPGIFFLKAINNFKFGVFLAGLLVIGYFALDFYKQKQIEKKANIRRFDLNQIIFCRASRCCLIIL